MGSFRGKPKNAFFKANIHSLETMMALQRIRRLAAMTALVAAALPAGGALAQVANYPNRPITLIVPWPAGGASDRHMRAVAEIASEHLGQPIVVENKPGGGGTNAVGQMGLSAKPDGYTIAQFPLGMLRVPHMQKTQWHPLNDFSYIAGISGYTFGVVVKSDSPYKSFNDYLDAARKEPGKIDFGSAGIGTSPHLLMEEVAALLKLQLTHVPYKGSAELHTALLGGHVMAASDATSWDKFVDGGQMRLLVTFSDKPTKRWPNVPTARSLGHDVVSTSPYGVAGPKGMDPAVVAKLQDAFKKAVEDPRNVALMDQLNQAAWYRISEDYRKWAADTFAKDKVLIDRLGLGMK
jgi:tripartite-type tricarboxylate transporter receptor subunit TctC